MMRESKEKYFVTLSHQVRTSGLCNIPAAANYSNFHVIRSLYPVQIVERFKVRVSDSE